MVVNLQTTDKIYQGFSNHENNFTKVFSAFEQAHSVESGEHENLKFISSAKPSSEAEKIKIYYDSSQPSQLQFVREDNSETHLKFIDREGEFDDFASYKNFSPTTGGSPASIVGYAVAGINSGVLQNFSCHGRNIVSSPVVVEGVNFLQVQVVGSLKNIQLIALGSSSIEKVIRKIRVVSNNVFVRFLFNLNDIDNKDNFYRISIIAWD